MVFQVLCDMNLVFLTIFLIILLHRPSLLFMLIFYPVLIQLSFPILGPFICFSVHLKAFPQIFA